jgi:hypothetical protein
LLVCTLLKNAGYDVESGVFEEAQAVEIALTVAILLDLTRRWLIAMEQKIAQQLLYLSSIEARQSMAVALNGKLAE